MLPVRSQSILATFLTLICLAGTALAKGPNLPGEWPQWRGPARDAKSPETGLLKKWPKDGPRLIWEAADAGLGYSSVAVAHGMVYTLGERGDGQYAIAYRAPSSSSDIAAGKPETAHEVWHAKLSGEVGRTHGAPGEGEHGERSTPTVDGDRLYVLTVEGLLACLDARTGAFRWRKDILREFEAANPRWGISESPLIEGDMVIVTPGGKKATVAALNKLTGETVWTSRDPAAGGVVQAAYASAVAANLAGVRQIVVFASTEALGVRAADGEFLWSYRGANNQVANVATPVVQGDDVLFSSGYGAGCGLVHVASEGGKIVAREVYQNKKLKNHHGGLVLVDGNVYGASDSTLTCMDFHTGKVHWIHHNLKASLAYADGRLYALAETGRMYLLEANPKKFTVDGEFQIPEGTIRVWAHPVIAGGKLYLRNQDKIWCYAVKQGG